MRRATLLLLLVVGTIVPSFLSLAPVHAPFTGPGTLCIVDATYASCPPNVPTGSFTGPIGGTLKVAVNIAGIPFAPMFNAYDLRVNNDPSLNATGVDLSGSVLPVNSTTLKALCINGVGIGCVSNIDGQGVVRVSINATGTTPVSAGHLFNVNYKIVGISTFSAIYFSTVRVSDNPHPCLNGGCNPRVDENPLAATFSNMPTLVPAYDVTVVPSFTYSSTTRTLSGTFAVTVLNDTDGTLLFSKTINVVVKTGPGGAAKFALAAPISPAWLSVTCTIDTATASVTGFMSGDVDVRHQGVVNIVDLASIAVNLGSTATSSGYDMSLDVNRDGVVNILDVAILASNFFIPVF